MSSAGLPFSGYTRRNWPRGLKPQGEIVDFLSEILQQATFPGMEVDSSCQELAWEPQDRKDREMGGDSRPAVP